MTINKEIQHHNGPHPRMLCLYSSPVRTGGPVGSFSSEDALNPFLTNPISFNFCVCSI
jgi:hypothetical protein